MEYSLLGLQRCIELNTYQINVPWEKKHTDIYQGSFDFLLGRWEGKKKREKRSKEWYSSDVVVVRDQEDVDIVSHDNNASFHTTSSLPLSVLVSPSTGTLHGLLSECSLWTVTLKDRHWDITSNQNSFLPDPKERTAPSPFHSTPWSRTSIITPQLNMFSQAHHFSIYGGQYIYNASGMQTRQGPTITYE